MTPFILILKNIAILLFVEPDYDYIEALAPYQPLQMKIAHCAIDTSLNFTQANKLIKDLKPTTLVVPESYTKPPVSAPNLTELVVHSNPDVNLIPYKWGEVSQVLNVFKCRSILRRNFCKNQDL